MAMAATGGAERTSSFVAIVVVVAGLCDLRLSRHPEEKVEKRRRRTQGKEIKKRSCYITHNKRQDNMGFVVVVVIFNSSNGITRQPTSLSLSLRHWCRFYLSNDHSNRLEWIQHRFSFQMQFSPLKTTTHWNKFINGPKKGKKKKKWINNKKYP